MRALIVYVNLSRACFYLQEHNLVVPSLPELLGNSAVFTDVMVSGPAMGDTQSQEGGTMRAELSGHFKACMAEIYLHIDARVSDYIRTHP